MKKILLPIVIFVLCVSASAQTGAQMGAQTRQPSTATRPFVVKTKQQVADIQKALEAQPGNKNEDIVGAGGMQMRVAVLARHSPGEISLGSTSAPPSISVALPLST